MLKKEESKFAEVARWAGITWLARSTHILKWGPVMGFCSRLKNIGPGFREWVSTNDAFGTRHYVSMIWVMQITPDATTQMIRHSTPVTNDTLFLGIYMFTEHVEPLPIGVLKQFSCHRVVS